MRWLWALPVVGVIWGAAVLKERPRIEADLKSRADAALESAGLGWASTSFAGIDATVTGRAYSEQSRERAKQLVAEAWGVWQVRDGTDLIEQRDNYVWSAVVSGQEVRLSGFFPDPEARKAIMKSAAEVMPKTRLQDAMSAARGAPDQAVWLPAIRFALVQLNEFTSGKVVLDGRKLSVEGVARNPAAYQRVKRAIAREVPKSITLARDEVRPPVVQPYTWSAIVDANQLVLAGFVPSETIRERLMAAAKAAFPKRAIVDKMNTAGGEPDGWLDTVKALIAAIAKLKSGTISISGKTMTVDGVAVEQATADQFKDLVAKIGAHYQVGQSVRYLEPTIPTVSPFLTSFLKSAKRLTLSGYAPDQAAIDRLSAVAKKSVPQHEIVTALAVARGAPEGWNLCVMAGLEAIAKLDTGRAELVGRKLQVAGVISDEEVGLNLPKIVRAAANRACDDVVEVKLNLPPEPKLNWLAEADKDQVRLKGEVPNSEVRASLVKMAAKLFGKRKVVDEMRVKPARSTKWPKVAGSLLELLAKLRGGTASIDGQSIGLAGQAPDTSVATAIKARLKRGLSQGYTGDAKIEIKSDAMIWAEEEAKRQAEARKVAEEKRRVAEEQKAKAAAEAAQREVEEAKRRAAEEARRKAEQAQQAIDDDLLRRVRERRERLTAETKRKEEQAAAARRAEEERRKAAEEAKRKAAAARQAEDDRLKRLVQERRERLAAEAKRKAEEAEAARLAKEARKKAAAAAKLRAAEEATRKAAAARQAEDDRLKRLVQERRERLAAEAKRKAEEAEAARLAEEARKKAAAAAKLRAAEEATRKAEAEAAKKRAAEEARRKAEERQRADDEDLRRRIRERRERLAEEARRKAEAEAEARRRERDAQLRKQARERREKLTPKQRAEETIKVKRCAADFGRVLSRNRIQFRFESAELLPRSRKTLDRLIRLINSCSGVLVEIGGHTDSLGRAQFNLRLSEQRALKVFKYLVAGGVPAERLVTKGYGETKPRYRNRGVRNRSLNRRIEFKPVWE